MSPDTEKMPKSQWRPTKAEKRHNKWRASRQVCVSSLLTADLQISAYEAAIRRHSKGRLLDLGCGNAPYAGIYSAINEEYFWADWEHSPHQIFQLDYYVDLNKTPLPLESNQFDTILLTDVLEHIAEPDKLMSEIVRMLRVGGKAIIGVPFLYPIHEQPNDHFRFTEYQLKYLASKHSLRTVEFIIVGGPLEAWVDLTSKILASVWSKLAWLPFCLGKTALKIPFVVEANKRSAWKVPLAYLQVVQK
jgi:SAM-dependent methyltransferase